MMTGEIYRAVSLVAINAFVTVNSLQLLLSDSQE